MNQLGVKPSVLFPKVQKKSPDNRLEKRKNSTSLSHPEKLLNINFGSLENSHLGTRIHQTHNPKVERN